MSNTVRIKRRASGSPGAPSSLQNAELAFNEVDSTLYYGVGTGGTGGSATTILAIGGPGQFATLGTTQTINGNKTFTGTVDLSGSTLTLPSVGTAGTYTKVTTDSKGRVTAGTTLSASDIPTLTASYISNFDTQVRTSRLDQMAAPTASVSFNSQSITNLADPSNAQDAATKNYVDAVKTGLDVKGSCRAIATSNITLSGTQTIDGVALVAGDRVLVAGQSTASQNGIYVVAAGAWSRSTDADNSPGGEFTPGLFTFIEEGTVNASTGWVCSTSGTITLGSTSIAFTQFTGAGEITAGTGLAKSGNTLSISGSYAGQSSIVTVGTISTGTWQGSVVGATYGGTGVNNGSSTLTMGGSVAFSGAYNVTFTASGTTSVTLPTSGTLLNDSATIDGGSF